MMGGWIATEIGNTGNVFVVEGIPSTSASDRQNSGIQMALANHPDVAVVGQVTAMWTDQVTQAEVRKWIATNPSDLNGIIFQSALELGDLR